MGPPRGDDRLAVRHREQVGLVETFNLDAHRLGYVRRRYGIYPLEESPPYSVANLFDGRRDRRRRRRGRQVVRERGPRGEHGTARWRGRRPVPLHSTIRPARLCRRPVGGIMFWWHRAVLGRCRAAPHLHHTKIHAVIRGGSRQATSALAFGALG